MNRYNKKPKDLALVKHTIKRFKERFNIDVDDVYISQLQNRIRNNKDCSFYGEQSCSRTVWIMQKDNTINTDFVAVYNKTKHKICTVFPLDYLEEWGNQEEVMQVGD